MPETQNILTNLSDASVKKLNNNIYCLFLKIEIKYNITTKLKLVLDYALKYLSSAELKIIKTYLSYEKSAIYLKNKTFVNQHLIKSGLVGVETSMDYLAKQRFLGLSTHKGNGA